MRTHRIWRPIFNFARFVHGQARGHSRTVVVAVHNLWRLAMMMDAKTSTYGMSTVSRQGQLASQEPCAQETLSSVQAQVHGTNACLSEALSRAIGIADALDGCVPQDGSCDGSVAFPAPASFVDQLANGVRGTHGIAMQLHATLDRISARLGKVGS